MADPSTAAGRLPFELKALLQELVRQGIVEIARAKDVLVRESSLRTKVSRQLSEKSPYASEPGPVDIIAAAELPWLNRSGAVVDGDAICKAVAPALRVDYRRIDPLKLDAALVTRTFSGPFAHRHAILPLEWSGKNLVVAFANPFDDPLAAELTRIVGAPILRVFSPRKTILASLDHLHGFSRNIRAAAEASPGAGELSNFEQLVALSSGSREMAADERPVVAAVDYLLRYAFDQRASDVHVESRREGALVRLRIDGVLHPVHSIPRGASAPIISRLKMLARMDIAEKRRPQDGRIKTTRDGQEVELRASTIPTAFGEKLVLRIFDPEVAVQSVGELGFESDELGRFEKWIAEPHGLILITGPTGSGKSTSLYATLRALASPDVNIITIEDPIEIIHDSLNQIQVQPKVDLDFAGALRHVLRQDPDIIMIGEIRDKETAQSAVQSALTGHLVFSTLHTNSAAESITRLAELGVERFLLSGALVGVMAQRLVRTVCLYCSEQEQPSWDRLSLLGLPPHGEGTFRRGRGCDRCRQTGFKGRRAIFEMLSISAQIREAMERGELTSALEKIGRTEGTRTLREAGARRVQRGETTIEEVLRVTSSR
jgi:general secretion pathway protein E